MLPILYPSPFLAKDFSAQSQLLLYALAYWMAAADEELTATEQEWLAWQFGKDRADELLAEFSEKDDAAFHACIEKTFADLDHDEKTTILKYLRPWLLSLAHIDNVFALKERAAIRRIFKEVGLSYIRKIHVRGTPGKARPSKGKSKRRWRVPFDSWPRAFRNGRFSIG
jgi:hypothetical protein